MGSHDHGTTGLISALTRLHGAGVPGQTFTIHVGKWRESSNADPEKRGD